jgi:hypothetical protein
LNSEGEVSDLLRTEESAAHFTGGLDALYRSKFRIDASTRIASAGGSFARHVAGYFRQRGFCVVDEETAPPGLAEASARRFGYGLHSARHGDICTARQLRQIAEEALGDFKPADAVWQRDERYFDALRPTVEPNGLSAPELVDDHRAYHLTRVKRVLEKCDIFCFMLDAAEAWEHEPSGTVYPVAPGVIAGSLNPAVHRLRRFTFQEICDDLTGFFELCKSINANVQFALSVVPNDAPKASGAELSITDDSIAVLRAVTEQFYRERPDVDYIPVYELAAQPHATEGFQPQRSEESLSTEDTRDVQPVAMDDDDEELERMLEGDALCEQILNETFKP